jgi:hypothetical protein
MRGRCISTSEKAEGSNFLGRVSFWEAGVNTPRFRTVLHCK